MSASSPIDLAITDGLVQSGVDAGRFTHAVYALAVDGVRTGPKAFGLASTDTIFDLASLTKPMATATLLLQCVERGVLHMRQPVGTLFETAYGLPPPGRGRAGEGVGPLPNLDGIEVQHLATHTSGLPPIPDWPETGTDIGRSALIGRALRTAATHPPGTHYAYSDAGYILLGEMIGRATGLSLTDAFRAQIAEPVGLVDTGFLPQEPLSARIAPTATDVQPGVVHDPRARDLGGVAGHAGLFGTASDVLTYLETVRTGGQPILSQASVARMASSRIDPAIGSHSIGWFCAGNVYLPGGDLLSDRAFGHSGFTGTMAVIDPEYALSLVLLTNRVINNTEDAARFLDLRRRFINSVAAIVSS